ncbi:SusD/RagB family nutrient-binding outer membrane lipoprotein [Sediminibacterium ginsengisoli]|uniref:Starch-binding associating with outer membrane n=1 Tax=Sediminibacterium ginsengisoli TaxID=413434 RepID=A0A1T4LHF7_9BACT|nr:SusD/RagB family nutrient-binding outer membrane lipoprotein [Sediminibacterium ginsengisoli]SJZ54143.1 Starch-binding associating with outer membrane [Sediminibacterium ginsengisoli]
MRNKLTAAVLLSAGLLSMTSCKKYLDINTDPDTTQEPSVSSVLPPILSSIPYGIQRDGVYTAKYVQNWNTYANGNADTYDRHGYSFSGGTQAYTWQMTYQMFGNNLNYLIAKSEKTNEPDYTAVGLALKAWVFQHTTDYNTDIPFYDAFKDGQLTFRYDTQETIYKAVDSMCRRALTYLDKADAMTGSKLAKGDFSYNGNLSKWRKFVYGVLARNWHHVSNKSTYNADSVISYCEKAMNSVADDFCIPFDATNNDNSNYWGTFRDNMGTVRQSNFIVRLLDGSAFTGVQSFNNRDPRISHMLSASGDTTNGNGGYRGVDPGVGDPYSAVTSGVNFPKKVAIAYGDSMYASPNPGVFIENGKYLFKNKAPMPVMTYAEMQFIKAEAHMRKGEKPKAYDAYITGIKAHFDFINRDYSSIRGALPIYNKNPIPTTTRDKYLASANVAQNFNVLTMSDIMMQKYIALWGWGFFETWVDLRRFHYIDNDPATGQRVYKTFNFPTSFASTNNLKPVYRVRPHYTSEYTYNLAELVRLGVLAQDYHTIECWFSQP